VETTRFSVTVIIVTGRYAQEDDRPPDPRRALAVDVTRVIGLFGAANLESLAHLDRAHELGRLQQGFEGAGLADNHSESGE